MFVTVFLKTAIIASKIWNENHAFTLRRLCPWS